jgi:hypothetical protein
MFKSKLARFRDTPRRVFRDIPVASEINRFQLVSLHTNIRPRPACADCPVWARGHLFHHPLGLSQGSLKVG